MSDQAQSRLKPRDEYFEYEGLRYVINDEGLDLVRTRAADGCTRKQIARELHVSDMWMLRATDPESKNFDERVYAAFVEGESQFLVELRQSQKELGKVNATMAIHLGKQYLEQRDQPIEVNHRHQVVGTLPDYSKSSDEWRRQFAPTALQQIEKDDVEDAEIVDTECASTASEARVSDAETIDLQPEKDDETR